MLLNTKRVKTFFTRFCHFSPIAYIQKADLHPIVIQCFFITYFGYVIIVSSLRYISSFSSYNYIFILYTVKI